MSAKIPAVCVPVIAALANLEAMVWKLLRRIAYGCIEERDDTRALKLTI